MSITRSGDELLFEADELIVSKTDTKGNITYGNGLFIGLSGYGEQELLGAPHNLVRHPDMPRLVFKLLWETVQGGHEIYAYVKNRSKDGGHYWVLANVTPSFDIHGKIIGYYSVRRKPRREALAKVIPLYKRLLDAEKAGGVEGSGRVMEDLLKEAGVAYEQFVLSL